MMKMIMEYKLQICRVLQYNYNWFYYVLEMWLLISKTIHCCIWCVFVTQVASHFIIAYIYFVFVNVWIVRMYCTVQLRIDLVVSRKRRCYNSPCDHLKPVIFYRFMSPSHSAVNYCFKYYMKWNENWRGCA